MSERFYLPDRLDRTEVTLSGPEAHHLADVLRLGPGAEVTLFDGQGTEAVAEIVRVGKREVTLRPGLTHQEPEPTAVPVTLAIAPPKGDRFRWLVEKSTELGMTRLVPLLTRRTVVDPRENKLDKLRQTVIAACKQCGRSRLMDVTDAVKLEPFLASPAENSIRVIAHPNGTPIASVDLSAATGVTLLVGPEGGFTDEEVAQATAAGSQIVSLGRTILRTETAGLAAAAVVVQMLAAGAHQRFSSS
jgi:16S rRNA (uracil1498-N3)-methyltransferase